MCVGALFVRQVVQLVRALPLATPPRPSPQLRHLPHQQAKRRENALLKGATHKYVKHAQENSKPHEYAQTLNLHKPTRIRGRQLFYARRRAEEEQKAMESQYNEVGFSWRRRFAARRNAF